MRHSLDDHYYQLPSVRRFLQARCEDLFRRRSLLLLLPRGIDPDLVWLALEAALPHQPLRAQELDLVYTEPSDPPPAALVRALDLDWPEAGMPRTAENLARVPGLPEILRLRSLERLPEARRCEWLAWLVRWAQVSHSAQDRGVKPMAVCLVAPAGHVPLEAPQSNTHLGVHWWWGFPSALEIQLLCRLALDGGSLSVEAQWREHVAPALAGNDLALIEYLWDDLGRALPSIRARLAQYAQEQGWDEPFLKRERAFAVAATRGPFNGPPPAGRKLWAAGALHWTPEYGLELNAAALAVLKQDDTIQHRLWRGQAELVLPLADYARRMICKHLVERYGADWPSRCREFYTGGEKDEQPPDPLACSLGYLEKVLTEALSFRAEESWLDLTRSAHTIRNQMAHYQPVDLQSYIRLVREVTRKSALKAPAGISR